MGAVSIVKYTMQTIKVCGKGHWKWVLFLES